MSSIVPAHINTFFVDLDGTLLETRYRQYDVFSSACNNSIRISVEEFWNRKREGKTNESILRDLNIKEDEITRYKTYWNQNIESREFLLKDFLFDFSIQTLQRWKINGKVLHLVTMRSREDNLFWQIRYLNIEHFFESIIACPHGRYSKSEAMQRNLGIDKATSAIIGDTETDIEAGKNLDIFTVAVQSGIRNRSMLMTLEPDRIAESISDI
jgi:phosphoglycolate phosphatase